MRSSVSNRRGAAPLGAALLLAAVALAASALLAGPQPLFVGDNAAAAGAEASSRLRGPSARRVVTGAMPQAPSRYADRYDEDDEDAYFDEDDSDDEDGDYDDYDDEPEEEEENQLVPVLYQWPRISARLKRQGLKPGHLVQRKWQKKGIQQGYASVPFLMAARNVIQDPEVNVCLVSRRERSDSVVQEWNGVFDSVPEFDISGEVSLSDLDPLEPAWETPLDEELPSDGELRAQMQEPEVLEEMHKRFRRPVAELEARVGKGPEEQDANILRAIVGGLPEELRAPEYRALVRSTSVEVLKLLWGIHGATGADQLRWRLACTDSDADSQEATGYEPGQFGQPGESLRAYFVIAGEGLDFVTEESADRNKV